MRSALPALLFVVACGLPQTAWAWGASGHRLVGELALERLPQELPAFLRTPRAAEEVGELSREPDRSRDAGKVHDSDRDPAHFLDVDEDGAVMGGPKLQALPPTRPAFETALRASGKDSWDTGYLPYAIIDRWQQVVHDFAYWRVLRAAEANPAWRSRRAWFTADRRRRETQILADIGHLSHFVSDAAQPLHVTIHHNGWTGANPQGFTRARVHSRFEGDVVRSSVRKTDVAAGLRPLRLCKCQIERRTAEFLTGSHALVIPLYELEKAGGLEPGDARGAAFARDQLARGTSELRDLIVEAWMASADHTVGWKPVKPADVAAGRVDPYPSLYGTD